MEDSRKARKAREWRRFYAKHRKRQKKQAREYYRKNRARILEYQRQYRRKNAATVREYALQYAAGHREEAKSRLKDWRQRNIGHEHGLTTVEYDAMLAAQGGVCAICRRPETERVRKGELRQQRLSIDHDHGTGEVRGLLCRACNKALAFMNDDPALLRAAADYLEATRAAPSQSTLFGSLHRC